MGRKSKHASTGHFPLTNHEIKQYSKPYGTTTARLSASSQYSFGNCALSLHPAKEMPVASLSGYIYEKPAILEYLVTQTRKLKVAQQKYDQQLKEEATRQSQEEERKRKLDLEDFQNSQKVIVAKKRKADDNPLKRTSYWLADVQPVADDTVDSKQIEVPPKRPPSPMSKRPLKRKELIDLDLKWNKKEQVLCALSEKSIVHQQALALITKSGKPAQVVLEKVFKDLGEQTQCPVTGRPLTKILKLQKGGSSFSSSGGVVEASSYRPTMT